MAFNDDILDAGQMREGLHQPNIVEYTAEGMTRFLHLIIDTFIRYIIMIGFIFAIEAVGIDSDSEFGLLFYVPYMLYHPIMEYYYGKTVAKMMTKTTVVNLDGSKLTFGGAVIRSLCRLIPFDAFSFLGSTAVGWHDSISKTRVVKDSFLAHSLEYDRYSF